MGEFVCSVNERDGAWRVDWREAGLHLRVVF